MTREIVNSIETSFNKYVAFRTLRAVFNDHIMELIFVFICLYTLIGFDVDLVGDRGSRDVPTTFALTEMLIWVVLRTDLQAHPAEVGATPGASHLVAPFDFLNLEATVWATLRTMLQVKKVLPFIDSISKGIPITLSLRVDVLDLLSFSYCNPSYLAPLVGMVL